MRGKRLKDLLSNVRRQDLVLQNMCVARSGRIECNVLPCYKHVGSLVDGLGRLECELQARIAAANRVYQPLAKKRMSAKYFDC